MGCFGAVVACGGAIDAGVEPQDRAKMAGLSALKRKTRGLVVCGRKTPSQNRRRGTNSTSPGVQSGAKKAGVVVYGETWRIRRIDPFNLALEVRRGKGSRWEFISYHTTVEGSLTALLNHRLVHPPDSLTVEELLNFLRLEVKRIASEIDKRGEK